jgi:hypothetical protein
MKAYGYSGTCCLPGGICDRERIKFNDNLAGGELYAK